MKKALIIVDMQNDFVHPSGKLYVKDAEKLVKPLLKKIKHFKKKRKIIIGSRDWHPLGNISFKKWGEHCVQKSWGAELVYHQSDLDLLISKGTLKNSDSFSAFYNNGDIKSDLNAYLRANKIGKLEIVGVAEDVCVKATYEDAIKEGFKAKINKKLTKPLSK